MLKRASPFAMACVWLLLLQVPAFAHADLKTAAPSAGSAVAEVKEIRLRFTEGVNPKFSGIDLKDQNGKKIAVRICGSRSKKHKGTGSVRPSKAFCRKLHR